MNLKEEIIKAWIVFYKMLPVLLFVGLLVGIACGDIPFSMNCRQDSMTYLSNIEKICNQSHPDKEFIIQHALSQNFGKERIHYSASIAGEDFEEKVVEWVKIIYYMGLIVTVIGGIVFLLLCL